MTVYVKMCRQQYCAKYLKLQRINQLLNMLFKTRDEQRKLLEVMIKSQNRGHYTCKQLHRCVFVLECIRLDRSEMHSFFHVGGSMYMCSCVCRLQACRNQKSLSGVFLKNSPPQFLMRQGLTLKLVLTNQLGWVACTLQTSFHLHLPSAGITGICCSVLRSQRCSDPHVCTIGFILTEPGISLSVLVTILKQI